jgi:signal transduction histidine kinase/ActR/RegA family two-component response regulator
MADTPRFEAIDELTTEELRQRLRSLQALIASAPVPIAIAHDPDCRFISANLALATLLGVPLGRNISMTPADGSPPLYRIQRGGKDLPEKELPMQLAIAHRASIRNDIEIVRSDGSVAYVQNDVEPLYDTHGEVYGCVSVCVDLTEQKLAQLALLEADRRKDEFLATLSHELRNPLAPLRSALEVMRLARDKPDVVERARQTMERQLMQLVRLTDDLLDVARITQNKLEMRRERVDLRSVMHAAVEAARPAIDSQGHSVHLDLPDTPLWADADPTRLAQVFSNLLNNAVKYTARGGHIHVSAAAEGADVLLRVQDDGVGIPAGMLPHIFDMFTQFPGHRDRSHGGLGIGLTLARRLVERHGGTIEATSDGAGHGSVFTVKLPAAVDAPVAARPAAGRSRAPARACRILVAEDNPDAREMLQLMLSLNGHDVTVASDGVVAVALATEIRPQIAFLDIGMPRMDGYDAARRIRETLGSSVVLVALTGWGQDEDKRRSREAGFNHHLTKPPDPEALEALIAECGQASRVAGG